MNYFSCTFARSSKLSSLCLSVLIISRKFMFVACSTQNYKWLATKQLSLLAVARTKARSKTPMGLKFSQNIGDPTRNHQGKRDEMFLITLIVVSFIFQAIYHMFAHRRILLILLMSLILSFYNRSDSTNLSASRIGLTIMQNMAMIWSFGIQNQGSRKIGRLVMKCFMMQDKG